MPLATLTPSNRTAIKKAWTIGHFREYRVTRIAASIHLNRTRSERKKLPSNIDLTLDEIIRKIKLDSLQEKRIKNRHRSVRSDRSKVVDKLGRKICRKAALKASSRQTSKQLVSRMQQVDDDIGFIRTEDLVPVTPAPNGEERVKGPQGTIYRPGVRFEHGGVLYYEVSPMMQQEELTLSVEFDNEFIHAFFDNKQNEPSFSFTVSREGIQERLFAKRPCTQRKIAGGYSAAGIFKAMGVDFDEALSRFFHLAHRHGWGIGGPQEKDNIDPATAGSNYTTLFYVEDVIRNIIANGICDEIHVKGDIEYHPQYTKLPIKITYTWHWFVNGEKHEMSKDIYPLNPRTPTIQENTHSRALASALSYVSGTSHCIVMEENDDTEGNEMLMEYALSSNSTPIRNSSSQKKRVAPHNDYEENDPLLANLSTSSSPQFFKPSKTSILRRSIDDDSLQKGEKTFAQRMKEEEERMNIENSDSPGFDI